MLGIAAFILMIDDGYPNWKPIPIPSNAQATAIRKSDEETDDAKMKEFVEQAGKLFKGQEAALLKSMKTQEGVLTDMIKLVKSQPESKANNDEMRRYE